MKFSPPSSRSGGRVTRRRRLLSVQAPTDRCVAFSSECLLKKELRQTLVALKETCACMHVHTQEERAAAHEARCRSARYRIPHLGRTKPKHIAPKSLPQVISYGTLVRCYRINFCATGAKLWIFQRQHIWSPPLPCFIVCSPKSLHFGYLSKQPVR